MSWVVSDLNNNAVVEIFNEKNLALFDSSKCRIESIQQYLERISRDISHGAALRMLTDSLKKTAVNTIGSNKGQKYDPSKVIR